MSIFFIPTYNEPLDVVKPTVYACLTMDWPKEKLHVHVLDDGSRPEFEEFSNSVGAGYIKREKNITTQKRAISITL